MREQGATWVDIEGAYTVVIALSLRNTLPSQSRYIRFLNRWTDDVHRQASFIEGSTVIRGAQHDGVCLETRIRVAV